MIFTEAGRMLCEPCQAEELSESDMGTWVHLKLDAGICEACGLIEDPDDPDPEPKYSNR